MENIIEKYKEAIGNSQIFAFGFMFLLFSLVSLIIYSFIKTNYEITLLFILNKSIWNIVLAFFFGRTQHKKYKEYLRVNGILQGTGN